MLTFRKKEGYTWDYTVFARLFDSNRKEAYKYRFETLGDPIPDEYQDEPKKEQTNDTTTDTPAETKVAETNVAETSSKDIETQLKEEYQKVLKGANVKFSHLMGTDKLKALCKEKGLID